MTGTDIGIVLALGCLSAAQASHWRNCADLFTFNTKVTPKSTIALDHLGNAL